MDLDLDHRAPDFLHDFFAGQLAEREMAESLDELTFQAMGIHTFEDMVKAFREVEKRLWKWRTPFGTVYLLDSPAVREMMKDIPLVRV